jgi:hypothetical protein
MWCEYSSCEIGTLVLIVRQGIGFTGSTICDAGTTCVTLNSCKKHNTASVGITNYFFLDYSQCQPSTATTPPSTVASGTTTSTAPSSSICSGTRTKFKYFGVNESGAEFGNTNIPGVLGTDYTWPSPSSVDVSGIPVRFQGGRLIFCIPVLHATRVQHLPHPFPYGAHQSSGDRPYWSVRLHLPEWTPDRKLHLRVSYQGAAN